MKPNGICLLLLIMLHAGTHAQNLGYNLDSIAGHFVKTLHSDNSQKIILETDRKVYAAGEKVWFKAFLVRALNNRLDTTSKNLFVDIVNSNDKVVAQLVLNTLALRTDGVLSLGDTLSTGYYWLRSYTRQMISDDITGIFLQPLYIINLGGHDGPGNTQQVDEFSPSHGAAVHFFSERYTLIPGINSTGAVQVTDAQGNPIAADGSIVTAQDSVVTNFTTNNFGLAPVAFFAVPGQTYAVIAHLPGGDVRSPLPAYDPYAAQISIAGQNNESIKAFVMLEDSVFSLQHTTYILGISGDSLCFAGKGKGIYQANIPVNIFPAGIATLLLVDSQLHILSERKVFINKSGYSINIQTDKQNYGPREKVHLKMDVTDAEGKPLVAALNISVQDDHLQQMSDAMETDTLQPATLSFSDWLLRNRSRFSVAETDLLMLAQKPGYKNIAAKSNETAIEDETGALLYLKGKIGNRKNEPLKDRIVTAVAKSGDASFFDIDTTNTNGRFQIQLPPNADSMLIKLEVTDKKGNFQPQDKISIDTFSFPHFATPVSLKQKFTSANIAAVKKLWAFHADTVFTGVGREWLKPVTVSTKTKPVYNYDVSKRVSQFSRIITFDQFKEGGVSPISDALIMVPGVALKGGYVAFLGGAGFGATANTEPLVVVDGAVIPVASISSGQPGSPVMNFLNTLNPGDIDFVEVITDGNAAIYGLQGGNGAIIINTLSGPRQSADTYGLKVFRPNTYHTAPRFAMPDYDDKVVKNNKIPDPRTTIYWNGNIITNTKGKAADSFYTADNMATYTVTITGITANGNYIYKQVELNRK